MDVLRAQMALHGYEVPEVTPKERERVWYSLAGKRRRAQLAATLQLDEDAIEVLVAGVRQERAQLSKRRYGHERRGNEERDDRFMDQ
jgi:hypothetical protein